jgi:hypothetical protein
VVGRIVLLARKWHRTALVGTHSVKVDPRSSLARLGYSFFPTRSRNHCGHHDAGIAYTPRPIAKPARPLLNTNHSFIALHSSCEGFSAQRWAILRTQCRWGSPLSATS